MGIFNRNLLWIFRIGPLSWIIRILVGIYCGFGKWGFWREWNVGFGDRGWVVLQQLDGRGGDGATIF